MGQELITSSEAPALVAGQDDYYDLAAQIFSNTVPVSWGPNVNHAKTVLEENLSSAILNGTSWAEAFLTDDLPLAAAASVLLARGHNCGPGNRVADGARHGDGVPVDLCGHLE